MHFEFLHAMGSLALTFLGVYLLLLSIYLVEGNIVKCYNARIPEHKIQKDKELDPALVKRDFRQSFFSIAYIAFLFSLGNWFYTEFGWGFQVHEMTVLNTVLSFVASMIVFDTWFYWTHRFLHTNAFFYKHAHQWHHLTRTPVVWTNNSDLFLNNFIMQFYWVIAHFIIPISPVVLLAHKLYDHISGVIGHSGYEYAGKTALPPSPLLCVTHHDQHHRYIRCNYATHFTFWDRMMGTLWPTYDVEAKKNILAKKNDSIG